MSITSVSLCVIRLSCVMHSPSPSSSPSPPVLPGLPALLEMSLIFTQFACRLWMLSKTIGKRRLWGCCLNRLSGFPERRAVKISCALFSRWHNCTIGLKNSPKMVLESSDRVLTIIVSHTRLQDRESLRRHFFVLFRKVGLELVQRRGA